MLGMDFFMDTPRCISLQHGKGNTSKYDGNVQFSDRLNGHVSMVVFLSMRIGVVCFVTPVFL